VHQDEDGMVVIRGRLAPEADAVLVQALSAARETLYQRARAKEPEDVSAETPFSLASHADIFRSRRHFRLTAF
jgi:hypothetical protein